MTPTYSGPPQQSSAESLGRRAVEYIGKLFARLEELPLDKRYKDMTFDLESVFSHLMRRRFGRDPTAYEAFTFASAATVQMRMASVATDTVIARLEELSAQFEQDMARLHKRLDKIEEDLFEDSNPT